MSQPFNYGIVRSYGHVWDETTQTWIPQVQPGESAGPTTVLIPDGSDATQGSVADVAVATDAPGTISSKLRGLVSLLRSLLTLLSSVWDGGTHLRVDGSSVTQPVSGPLTDTQLRATAVSVDGSAVVQPISATNLDVALSTRLAPGDTLTKVSTIDTVTNPVAVTNTNLDAALSSLLKPADTLTKVGTLDTITNPVAVTGSFYQATQPVSGPLTDTELRAAAVPVSGPLTDTELRAASVPVSGPLTDTELRASAVPVDGSGVTQPVSGPLTDTELRASEVPVSVASLPLPSSASLEAGGNLETLVNMTGALLIEMRLLRQAFEDWSGTRPRYDPRFDPDRYEVQ